MAKVRLSKSKIGDEEKQAVLSVLDKEYLGMGEEVRLFEQEIKAFLKTPLDVVCVNTGTAALHLACLCLDFKEGDEVLVPTLTYVSSFQAISATGVTPVPCDVCENTLFIDLNDAEMRVTSRTKAIMPVHYASDSQGMIDTYTFAKKHKLRVIEDAAHAFGGSRNGKLIGQEGDILCFSFDGIKNITCGEGGALLSADQGLIKRVQDARLLGVEKDTEKRYAGQRSWEFDVSHQGFRYHMSNIMAAIGRAQLHKIEKFRSIRQRIAHEYLNGLSDIKGLRFLALDYDNIVPHIFVVRILDQQRDALRDFLLQNEIETGIHYKPNHLLKKYRPLYPLPVAERLFQETLTLPIHADLDEESQRFVILKIREYFHAH